MKTGFPLAMSYTTVPWRVLAFLDMKLFFAPSGPGADILKNTRCQSGDRIDHMRCARRRIKFNKVCGSDDERLAVLNIVAITHDEFIPGQQTSYEIGRFRFHYPETSLDGFLNHITRIAVADSEERGQFAGKLPEGDDPWSPEWRLSRITKE